MKDKLHDLATLLSPLTSPIHLHSFKPLHEIKPHTLWQSYGYIKFNPTTESQEIAQDIVRFIQREDIQQELAIHKEEITGKSYQAAFDNPDWHILKQRYIQYIQSLLPTFLPNWKPNLPNAHHNTFKILSSATGDGEQLVHWDSNNWNDLSWGGCYMSIAFYCVDTDSTALPNFDAKLLSIPPNKQSTAKKLAYLLDKQFYHSIPVAPGTVIIFSHRTPHYGVTNKSLHDRIVLFLMITDESDEQNSNQDDQQYNYINYIEDAYGPFSLQHMIALLETQQHNQFTRVDEKYDFHKAEQSLKNTMKNTTSSISDMMNIGKETFEKHKKRKRKQ